MSDEKLPIHAIIEEAVEAAGSGAQFIRWMEGAGGPLTWVTYRAWRNGSKPNRPRHILALSKITGRTPEELLKASMPPGEVVRW